MRKLITAILICFLTLSMSAQTTLDKKIQYIQSFLYQNSLYEKKQDCKLWVNKTECQVEIGYTKFNLNDIKMTYRFHDQESVNLVGFMCKAAENCIEMRSPINNQYSYGNGYYFGFKTKESCYRFMDLVGDLRNSLNKNNGN